MAQLPPRKNSTPTKPHKPPISPLRVLLQMGFSKSRAEKALAATGFRNVQLASDWLLAHVNDPTLDDKKPREYLLYLVPTGDMHDQLHAFWSQSAEECGHNGAHEFMPHITLIPPFKVPDGSVPDVVQLLETLISKEGRHVPGQLKLEPYISPNFMGFFINQEQAAAFKSITANFAKGLAQMNIAAESHTSQALHLTLAYSFAASQYGALESLVKTIDPRLSSDSYWQLRLYSRDVRLAGKKVYKVIYPHVARETDELELILGDFIYAEADAWNNSVDGWIEGISWLTGCTGFLPKNYVEKTAESDSWTLHRTFELGRSMTEEENSPTTAFASLLNRRVLSPTKPNSVSPRQPDWQHEVVAGMSPVGHDPSVRQTPLRRIFIVRHGERVDFTFGSWIPYCFDCNGKYVRKDLNMPLSVPQRKGSPDSFFKDCPLTMLGETQAHLLGEALQSAGIDTIRHVYCSPSLRSLQTCRNILRGLGVDDQLPIGLEPGLFEWLAWYLDSMPQFLTRQELMDAGFNMDERHLKPFVDFEELADRRETSEQYYMRSHYVVQSALKSTEHLGGDVLLVGHASTLDACSRQLLGGTPRSAQELSRLVHRIPYCSLAVVQQQSPTSQDKTAAEDVGRPSEWSLIEPPVPPMTYSANLRFDWQTLLS